VCRLAINLDHQAKAGHFKRQVHNDKLLSGVAGKYQVKGQTGFRSDYTRLQGYLTDGWDDHDRLNFQSSPSILQDIARTRLL
jgi:hypothetical protein